jgi:hypothetical protein
LSVSPTSEVLKKVQELAAECGIEGEHNLLRGEFVVLFGLPGDRTQEVFVSDTSVDPDVTVISVRSTCLVIDKGMLKGISKPMALELLMMNEKLNFARYGVQEDDESFIVVASYDLLLDGLAAKGLALALECVALTADSYEEKFGQDIF